MSDLRKGLIKLAYENPELRDEILPLLEETKTASDKEASFSSELLRSKIDMTKYRQVAKMAKEAGWDKLLNDIRRELMEQLQPAPNVERALNRFSNMLSGRLDEGMLRNQAFKVADELKLRLPHGIFASEDDDNT